MLPLTEVKHIMQLHRTGQEGQWKQIPFEEQNASQRIAERTNGFITPANAVSFAGAGLVLSGLKDISGGDDLKGITKVGVGRLADMVDGAVAAKTGTMSPTGEAVDAIADKVIMAAALPVMSKRQILPDGACGIMFAQNLASSAFSALAKRQGRGLQPSAEGKLATFSQWSSIGLYGLASVARNRGSEAAAERLSLAGRLSTVVSVYLGAKAISGYAHETYTKY